ncbi:hypothetical protein [Lacticaseibacillus saniviri]|uniref:hypothetical protein n=1 Tax=Lacticaseibacillus saniviri TaxID=931533 RepID=UPI0006D0A9AD|nr:hypothetical protein [Lacticaseibacillus saniviri]
MLTELDHAISVRTGGKTATDNFNHVMFLLWIGTDVLGVNMAGKEDGDVVIIEQRAQLWRIVQDKPLIDLLIVPIEVVMHKD